MHLLKHTKKEKPKPLVPIVSHFKVPYFRKMRGRRFNAAGDEIGASGPPKPVPDVRERENLLKQQSAAAAMPPPVDSAPFTLDNYRPLPGRVLLKRPPQITHENGVLLPEKHWRSQSWFFVVKVGSGVTICQPGDRVIFDKRGLPKPVRLGAPYHLGKAKKIISIVEP